MKSNFLKENALSRVTGKGIFFIPLLVRWIKDN
jgi:hypothetical protein